jgi:hypothetical protein
VGFGQPGDAIVNPLINKKLISFYNCRMNVIEASGFCTYKREHSIFEINTYIQLRYTVLLVTMIYHL